MHPVHHRLPLRLLAAPLTMALAGLFTPALSVTATQERPPLMLAKVYQSDVALADYWVSEKYDGVRGYWDGAQLLTRGGERINAPTWFTAGWPQVALDGELWAGRGQFSKAVSTVRRQSPDDAAWRTMRFMVFDLPAHGGAFTERLVALNRLVGQINQPWVHSVAQSKVTNHAALQLLLNSTVKDGGEGLALHRGASLYQAQRNDDFLKFKPFEDAEARVVAHLAGRGKYAGKVGALLVEIPGTGGQAPQRFKLGTGLSDADRQDPPAIGSVVTFRFRGVTDKGVPRFASFMRMAADQPI